MRFWAQIPEKIQARGKVQDPVRRIQAREKVQDPWDNSLSFHRPKRNLASKQFFKLHHALKKSEKQRAQNDLNLGTSKMNLESQQFFKPHND